MLLLMNQVSNWYNVFFRTRSSLRAHYLLMVNDEKLAEFCRKYHFGEKHFTLRGMTYDINLVNYVKIHDHSLVDKGIPLDEAFLKHFENILSRCCPLREGSTIEMLLQDCGKDVTERFILHEFGGMKGNDSVTLSGPSGRYIDESRIVSLKRLNSVEYDFSKLVQLCLEANSSFSRGNYYSVGMLSRAIVDHVPPIFGFTNFDQVAANYKAEGDSKSFKESMEHLNKSMKKISDSFLHSQIRRSEILPNENSVDCKRDIDRLLGEIIRKLNADQKKVETPSHFSPDSHPFSRIS
jgi:hypothetical protein